MNEFSWTHLADAAVKRDLAAVSARHSGVTAELLAGLAEFNARKLYAPAGYPSMHAYCVDVLRMSRESAYKRMRVANTAREFPVIFVAIAEGRLNLSDVIVLTPYLTVANAADLVSAASGKSRGEIELLLAERFPRPDVHERVAALAPCDENLTLSPGTNLVTDPEQATPKAPRTKVTPIAPQRYALQCTLGQAAHEKLVYAQALAGHAEGHDLAELIKAALDACLEKEEKKRFAVTSRPGKRRASGDTRHVPAEVMRAVYARDGGRCTFIGEGGHRCNAREGLEFDHEVPFARGGRSTVKNLRLRCHAHNQYEAEQTYGKEFMGEKRRAAQEKRQRADSREPAATKASAAEDKAALARARAVIGGLTWMGCSRERAEEIAKETESSAHLPIGEHMKTAIKAMHSVPPEATSAA